MRNALRSFLVLSVVVASSGSAQSSLGNRQAYRASANALALPPGFHDAGEKVKDFFGSGGLGFGIGDPRATLEGSVYTLEIYGRPIKIKNPDGSITYKEHVAFEMYADTYIVDGLGKEIRSLKEYLFSKKGSPIAIRLPLGFTYWNTKQGEVNQFWMGGQGYMHGKVIPLGLGTDTLRMNGSLAAGYTQQFNIDFAGNKNPGNVFLEFTPTINVIVGNELEAAVAPSASKKSRYLGGLDYRFGFKFGKENPKSISLAGTLSFADLKDGRGLFGLVFSASH